MAAIIRRITLVADELTPVSRPGGSDLLQVSVMNGTSGVLLIYAGDTGNVPSSDNYIRVAAGQERLLRFRARGSDDVIFYLKSSLGGDVAFIWG